MQNLAPHPPPDTRGQMLRIGRFEECASAGYLAGKIWGAVRCCVGERRSPPASVTARDRGDRIIREGCHAWTKTPNLMLGPG